MMIYRRWSVSLSSALWLVLAAALWAAFAPLQMGGSAAYIIVNGVSMEPNFRLGDLIIVSPSSQYNIGDAVVYRNQGMGGKNVFHRIIEVNAGRYILQGDNNSWVDSYQPAKEEIIGKLWFHIPRGGKALERARTPIGMAVSVSVLGFLLATGFFPERMKGKNKMKFTSIRASVTGFIKKAIIRLAEHRHAIPPPGKKSNQTSHNSGNTPEFIFFVLGIISFSSFILAIVSFSRPAFDTVKDAIGYSHLGAFSYSTAAPQGVYDENKVKTGDPIFPGLTCKVEVGFQYILLADGVEGFSGTRQLIAVITDPVSGWKRTLPLEEPAQFAETSTITTARLDLCKIASLVESFEENSSSNPGYYELTLHPQISISAVIEGRELRDTFNAGLKFKYDRNQFYVIQDAENDPFNPAKTGALGRDRIEADTLSLFGLKVEIPALRMISVIGLAGALAGMFLLWRHMQSLSKKNRVEFIRTQFGVLLVDVQKTKFGASKSLIDVSSIEDLGKLAERHNTMILHERQENASHIYYVQAEISTYRYILDKDPDQTDIL